MSNNKLRNDAGLTLVEILIGIVITTLIMGALYTSYNVVNKTYSQVSEKANISKTSRDLVSMLMRDIRMAGFKFYVGTHDKKKYALKTQSCNGGDGLSLPTQSYFTFNNGYTDENDSHNPVVIRSRTLGNSKITHNSPENLSPPLLPQVTTPWSQSTLTPDQKKILSTDLCCDQIEIVYEDFNINHASQPFKKYRITYFAEKTGGGDDPRYGAFKSIEMWHQPKIEDCTWPDTLTGLGWVTDEINVETGERICPECVKRELIRDYVVDMEFIPFDQYGVIIKSETSGEYPRPVPQLGDQTIRERLYDIRGVDIRLTFRTKEKFFSRISSSKRKPKELLSDRNQSNTNTTNNQTDVTGNTNNMEDLFLRDSVIVSVNTRNIGKGSF